MYRTMSDSGCLIMMVLQIQSVLLFDKVLQFSFPWLLGLCQVCLLMPLWETMFGIHMSLVVMVALVEDLFFFFFFWKVPPLWPSGKASASRAVRIPLAPGFFLGRVIPVTSKLALQWLPCQAPGVIGSALGLVGPVSVYCDWVR